MKISRRKLLLGVGAAAVVAGGATVIPMVRREGRFESTKSRVPMVEGTEGALPKSADVVIIGAGLQGIMTAINLTERGMNVVICEKGVVGGEQSGRAYSQIISYKTSPEIFPLHHYGKILWAGMNEKIGADTSFRTQGRVEVPSSEEDLEVARAWIKTTSENPGFDTPLRTRMIEGAELAKRLPDAQTPWKIAGFEEDSGSLDPEVVTPTMAKYAKSIGVKIYTNCAVRGLETAGGKISDVVTEKGAINTSNVVLTGGIWSRLFMGNLGVDVPTLNVYLSQQRITGVPGAPKGNVHLPNGIHFREQADGTYAVAPRIFTSSIVKDSFLLGPKFLHVLGGSELPLEFSLGKDLFNSFMMATSWNLDEKTPFEEFRTATNTPNTEHLDGVLARLRKEFPVFNESKVVERWGGTVSPTDDEIPIISEVKQYPGLVINTATGWGMTESPASGQLTADLVMGTKPIIDPHPYRLSRFTE
ncbi:NAD(P)/FAD-dependent oxidoreductase [Providencia sneebia]|uniref:Amino acid deaminase n=1 Tax=Providencia sneebia DSM 19967 TaxID=1141660 RepID=K8WSC2_9GAMM|nr:FAD-dependent oxidoreductase [Providencia sneebia]EKT60322.1 amino acid deaminase [Providencia sneebia DSM 19967]